MKSQVVQFAKKLRKNNFLRQSLTQISKEKSIFWDKGETINVHVTYPPLESAAMIGMQSKWVFSLLVNH